MSDVARKLLQPPRLIMLLLVMSLATVLAGCGVRGSLDLPPDVPKESTTAQADSGQGRPAGAAPKPHRPFIFDDLLR